MSKIIVIGGGAAGLMAAITAAELGGDGAALDGDVSAVRKDAVACRVRRAAGDGDLSLFAGDSDVFIIHIDAVAFAVFTCDVAVECCTC